MTPPDLIAIDPGRTTGWACFRLGKLQSADGEKFEDVIIDPCLCTFGPDVIIEKPQWRPHEKKVDINDLINLAVMVGRFEQIYKSHGSLVELVWPSTWKGSVPKNVHNQRVLACLTKDELSRVPVRPRARTPDHNCVDAIGLGLWKLGRMR